MVALHLGIEDEERILNMSGVFFEQVMREIGYKLNYEAISNYAGNSFAENSWDMIMKNNPMNITEKSKESEANNMANILGKGEIKIISSPDYAKGVDQEMRALLKDMLNKHKENTEDKGEQK